MSESSGDRSGPCPVCKCLPIGLWGQPLRFAPFCSWECREQHFDQLGAGRLPPELDPDRPEPENND